VHGPRRPLRPWGRTAETTSTDTAKAATSATGPTVLGCESRRLRLERAIPASTPASTAVRSALAYSTYLGRGGADEGAGIAVDPGGSAHVTGTTTSADFPTTPTSFDGSANDGADAFLTKLELPAAVLRVPIDIKPGSATSPINLRSQGVIPVAILSTATLDATTVDPRPSASATRKPDAA
jgi:hypothetical protein